MSMYKHAQTQIVHTNRYQYCLYQSSSYYLKILVKTERIEKTSPEQIFLTMCHPAMFTLITGSQVNLPWLKTFTCAIYECTADSLEKETEKTC